MLTNSYFPWKTASVDISWLLISTCWKPEVAGVAPDLMENKVDQLFHTKIGGFFLQPLENGK
jgi:hypothetical protein